MANGDVSVHEVIDVVISLLKGKGKDMGASAGQIVWLATAGSMHLKNNLKRYIYIFKAHNAKRLDLPQSL